MCICIIIFIKWLFLFSVLGGRNPNYLSVCIFYNIITTSNIIKSVRILYNMVCTYI